MEISLGKIKIFFITFIGIILNVAITPSYCDEIENLMARDAQEREYLNKYDRLMSKGTPKEQVYDFLGAPDKIEKSFWLGQEIWHYNDIRIYDIDLGRQSIVFQNDKVFDISNELFPPETIGSKQIFQTIFFPAYIVTRIPGMTLLEVPLFLGCLAGAFVLQGWLRFFCIYILLGIAYMFLPWVMLVIKK